MGPVGPLQLHRLLKHALLADERLPTKVSWCLLLEDQLQGHLIASLKRKPQPAKRHGTSLHMIDVGKPPDEY